MSTISSRFALAVALGSRVGSATREQGLRDQLLARRLHRDIVKSNSKAREQLLSQGLLSQPSVRFRKTINSVQDDGTVVAVNAQK